MKAMFFDMDGTIIDSRADLAATVNHTRRDLGLAERPMDEILVHVGCGAKHLLAHSIPERSEEVDRLWEIFRSHYAEHMLEHCALYPGVEPTLAELKRRGWALGVNTAKPSFATRAILAHFGLDRYFGDAVVAGGDCAEMKPSALPLYECAAKMGHTVGPGDWMVGDNWTDMDCAVNAGVKGAFCEFGFGVLKNSVYTAKIASFDGILSLI